MCAPGLLPRLGPPDDENDLIGLRVVCSRMISRCHLFQQRLSRFAALHNSGLGSSHTGVEMSLATPIVTGFEDGLAPKLVSTSARAKIMQSRDTGANSMRRQMGKFIPVVMIAIWAQIFAPVGAYFAMAAASDPFGSAPICSPSSTVRADQSDPAGQQQSHPDCCQLCVVAQSGAAPLKSPEPSVATLVRSSQQIVWHDRQFDLPSGQRGSHAQARAPPSYS